MKKKLNAATPPLTFYMELETTNQITTYNTNNSPESVFVSFAVLFHFFPSTHYNIEVSQFQLPAFLCKLEKKWMNEKKIHSLHEHIVDGSKCIGFSIWEIMCFSLPLIDLLIAYKRYNIVNIMFVYI